MKAQLGRHSDTIYALLRIVVGFLFACHGAQKLMAIATGVEIPMPAPLLWLAMLIELIGGRVPAIGFGFLGADRVPQRPRAAATIAA